MSVDEPATLPWDPQTIDAVVFDIGGIFAIPHHERVRAQVAAAGLSCSADDIDFKRGHWAGVHRLAVHHDAAIEADPTFWRQYDEAYFAEITTTDDLSVLVDDGLDRLWNWVLADAIVAAHRLAHAGVPIAVVSNNDGTAEQQMVDFGVGQVGPGPLPQLVAVVDSTALGIAKPDPAIFAPALDALDIAPERVLYLGDTVLADVRGATAAGMPVIQIDPFDHHVAWNHERRTSVALVVDELLAAR